MHCLVDADVIVYRAAFSAERTEVIDVDGKRERSRYITSEKDAFETADQILDTITNEYPSGNLHLYLSGADCFRKVVSPEYKANRNPADRPLLYDDMIEYMEHLGAVSVPHLEADDVMSIIQWTNLKQHEDWNDSDCSICSIDKDLNTIPGNHFNFVTGEGYWVELHEADYWLYSQLLIGDSSDNIPGVKGIGAKKAAKALAGYEQDEHAMFNIVISLYEKAYGNKAGQEAFHKNLSLLRMLTNVNARIPGLTKDEQSTVQEAMHQIIYEDLGW